jgi:PKD repeat protein
MRKLFFLFIVLLAFISCKKDSETIISTACFDYSPTTKLTKSTEISFSNCSQNAISYVWSFGDGTTSYDKEPKHTFSTDGTYNILLMVQNDVLKDVNGDRLINWLDGTASRDTISKTIIIGGSSSADLKACFDYTPKTNLNSAVELTFTNCSQSAVSYLWIFGDGNSSSQYEPKHIFSTSGTYKVILLAQSHEIKDVNADGIINLMDATTPKDTISMTILIN